MKRLICILAIACLCNMSFAQSRKETEKILGPLSRSEKKEVDAIGSAVEAEIARQNKAAGNAGAAVAPVVSAAEQARRAHMQSVIDDQLRNGYDRVASYDFDGRANTDVEPEIILADPSQGSGIAPAPKGYVSATSKLRRRGEIQNSIQMSRSQRGRIEPRQYLTASKESAERLKRGSVAFDASSARMLKSFRQQPQKAAEKTAVKKDDGDNWPYPFRIPITQRKDSTYEAYLYATPQIEKLPLPKPDYFSEERDAWKRIPSLSEKKLAVLQGSVMLLNDGELPEYTTTYDNGKMEFGTKDNTFIVDADGTGFWQLQTKKHDSNILQRIENGQNIGELSASVNVAVPSTPDISYSYSNNDELSVSKSYPLNDDSKPKASFSVQGKANIPIYNDTEEWTVRRCDFIYDHLVCSYGTIIPGAKADINGKFSIGEKAPDWTSFTSSSTPFVKSSVGASLQALAYKGGVEVNSAKKENGGYMVKSVVANAKIEVGAYATLSFSKVGKPILSPLSFKLTGTTKAIKVEGK